MTPSWLRNVPLFKRFTGDELNKILKSASLRKYGKNAHIVTAESKAGNEFFILRKGKVKVTKREPDGGETILAILGAGDFFGEMSLLDGLARSADVITVEPVETLVIPKDLFYRILNDFPSASIQLLKVLSGRLRRSDAERKASQSMNAVGKVSNALLSLADYGGKRAGSGIAIENAPTMQSLAEMSAVPKQTVQKILTYFQKAGYIVREGRELKIKNYHAFKAMFC